MFIKRGFKIRHLLLMSIFLFIQNDYLHANELSGTQIMKNFYDRENGDDVSSNIRFDIIYRNGTEKVRDTRRLWIDLDAKGGMEEKLMFFFHSPPEIKDTAFLSWNYKKYDKYDDQWVYLPALRKIRRISSSSKHDSFFGTEFSYSDLNSRDLEEDTHTLLKTALFQDIECYIVKSIPRDKKDIYSKVVNWIDPERWIPLKVEYYNRKGEHLKTQLLEWEQIQDIWTPTNLSMKNHLNGNKTIVTVKEVLYNNKFKEKLFHERTLKRGVR